MTSVSAGQNTSDSNECSGHDDKGIREGAGMEKDRKGITMKCDVYVNNH